MLYSVTQHLELQDQNEYYHRNQHEKWSRKCYCHVCCIFHASQCITAKTLDMKTEDVYCMNMTRMQRQVRH